MRFWSVQVKVPWCPLLPRSIDHAVARFLPAICMMCRFRLQSRRLYDCLVSVLDEKGHDFGEIRRVLEKGMKNGALSLMKDVSQSQSARRQLSQRRRQL